MIIEVQFIDRTIIVERATGNTYNLAAGDIFVTPFAISDWEENTTRSDLPDYKIECVHNLMKPLVYLRVLEEIDNDIYEEVICIQHVVDNARNFVYSNVKFSGVMLI